MCCVRATWKGAPSTLSCSGSRTPIKGQANNATIFMTKFYDRANLIDLYISVGPNSLHPDTFIFRYTFVRGLWVYLEPDLWLCGLALVQKLASMSARGGLNAKGRAGGKIIPLTL
ncbi:hypothetical protein ZIOFF_024941 [Zingiber officinale]|uniref:Uncharacterized protein n=1 Tax=Zingiber officinale TaxID=94328 RepID=A0A8J5H009_ZINOF|nr:hypothetical protein ZIOFF_024941 [Zingiber officinale]